MPGPALFRRRGDPASNGFSDSRWQQAQRTDLTLGQDLKLIDPAPFAGAMAGEGKFDPFKD